MDNQKFYDVVAMKCYDFFDQLPKNGKPKSVSEWTVMCCIVKSINRENLEVVSLGTGSKCIGINKMSSQGNILNDSHAEVMARRGFMRYLYEQIQFAYENKQSIFYLNDEGKCSIKADILFHFFSTQSPCGDISNIDVQELEINILHSTNSEEIFDFDKFAYKALKLNSGKIIKLSGAKSLLQQSGDSMQLGAPSVKPGKGDPTASLSCSDKLARWIRMGVQGALLDMLLDKPIYLNSIIIAGGCPFSMSSFYRGLVDRKFDGSYENNWDILRNQFEKKTELFYFYLGVVPIVGQSQIKFKYAKCEESQPSPASIVWCKVQEKPMEIAIAGIKLGTTKKNAFGASASLKISKINLLKSFMSVVYLQKNPIGSLETVDKLTYKQIKLLSTRYNNKWNQIKSNIFGIWSNKPDLENFSLNLEKNMINLNF